MSVHTKADTSDLDVKRLAETDSGTHGRNLVTDAQLVEVGRHLAQLVRLHQQIKVPDNESHT